MKIEFLVGNYLNIEEMYASKVASVRMRMAVAAEALKNKGNEVIISDGKQALEVDYLFIGKIDYVTDKERYIRWIDRVGKLENTKAKIVLDYTDNHLAGHTLATDFYKLILKNNRIVVICNSHKMLELLIEHKIKRDNIYIINEPIEIEKIEPNQNKINQKIGLWFGHLSNIEYLYRELIKFQNFFNENKVELIILTNNNTLPEKLAQDLRQIRGLKLKIRKWSVPEMIKSSEEANFIFLPTGYKDIRKKGASSNRLLTSIMLGLPILSNEHDSYLDYKNYYEEININNMHKIIINNEFDINKIKEGQNKVENENSKKIISEKWVEVFENINQEDVSGITNENYKNIRNEEKVRINLGCGDKIIEGYINVDVVESRAGKKPDIICDLHKLDIFENNFADEVMAIHVIEHFWQWEINDILLEWKRILKNNGKLILECPNLITAAHEFIKNPDLNALGGKEGQRSMWVFYGDPAWKDPYMIHRWGYTPKSLAFALHKAGFKEIKQEPAQFKLKEPRDMRITALKID